MILLLFIFYPILKYKYRFVHSSPHSNGQFAAVFVSNTVSSVSTGRSACVCTCGPVDGGEELLSDEEADGPACPLSLAHQEGRGLGVGSQGGAPCWEGHWVCLVLQTALDVQDRLPHPMPPQDLTAGGREGHRTVHCDRQTAGQADGHTGWQADRLTTVIRPKKKKFVSGFRPTLSIYVRPKLFYELFQKKKALYSTSFCTRMSGFSRFLNENNLPIIRCRWEK